MPVDVPEEVADQAAPDSPSGAGEFGRRVFRSLLDIMELELEIITLRVGASLRGAAVRIFLALAVGLLIIVGITFLEIAIFQALAAVWPLLGVFLLFAFGHLASAGVLLWWMRFSVAKGSD